MMCSPIGSPLESNPQGTVKAGVPKKAATIVKNHESYAEEVNFLRLGYILYNFGCTVNQGDF